MIFVGNGLLFKLPFASSRRLETAFPLTMHFSIIFDHALGDYFRAAMEARMPVLICNWNDAALSFQYNHYGNYLLFFLGAAAGSAIIFCISMLIEKCKAFEFIGQNTLIILLWHKFPILLFQSTGFGKSMVKNADSITSIIVGIVLVLISALLSLLVGFIFQKFFALFTMRKERN